MNYYFANRGVSANTSACVRDVILQGGRHHVQEMRVPLLATALACVALPAWGAELPEGKGKELVGTFCNTCHGFNFFNGYTPEGWRTVMRMMDNHGVTMAAEVAATVTENLTTGAARAMA